MSAAIALMRALEGNQREKEAIAGFKAMIRAYFDEYTDATEIDRVSYIALDHWFEIIFISGETEDEKELDDLIDEVKKEMGRN
jgi:hypothetical protein